MTLPRPILYHHPGSANSRRALLAAVHCGIEIDVHEIDFSARGHLSAPFQDVSPAGRVPVLVDDGFMLSESCAIMQYLADAAGASDVYPSGARTRASVNQWLFWCTQHLQAPASALNVERFVKPVLHHSEGSLEIADAAEAEWRRSSCLLDMRLKERAWIVSDDMTLADLAIAPVLSYADTAQLPLEGLDGLARWFEAVSGLQCWTMTGGGAYLPSDHPSDVAGTR